MKINEAAKLRILYFLVFSCTASWLPIFADYLKERGLTGIQIGVILSITPLMMFLVQPLYGMLADRLGYKKCFLWSSFFAALSYLFYLLQGNFASYLLITVCMSFFYNSIQPLLDSLSLRLIQKDPALSYGTLRIAGAAGWAFTGTLVGHYIDEVNTSVIFVFSAITMFLTFIFAFSIQGEEQNAAVLTNKSSKDLSAVFRNRDLLFMLFCVFLISAGGTTIWNFYSIYMKENGASASVVGYGISIQGLCELPLFYFSARIIRNFGMKTTLLITTFTLAFRMMLYATIKNPYAALCVELLHGISWSLFWVVCVEHVNWVVPEEWRATGQSLLYAAYFGIGAIAGNFWTGYLYDANMRIADIFLLNACMVAVVGLFMLLFMRNKSIRQDQVLHDLKDPRQHDQ
jgi:MFS transporter, PPP family, 3-phenylpropionic acid transporter